MSSRKHEEYLNTAQEGMIILVEHNLKTLMPDIVLYEPININDFKVVPLYDSRIASIESRGENVVEISFNSAFEGYINFIDVKNTRDSIEDRLARVEDLLDYTIQQQKQLTSLSQWKQMNAYFESKIDEQSAQIAELEKEIEKIKSDIEAL